MRVFEASYTNQNHIFCLYYSHLLERNVHPQSDQKISCIPISPYLAVGPAASHPDSRFRLQQTPSHNPVGINTEKTQIHDQVLKNTRSASHQETFLFTTIWSQKVRQTSAELHLAKQWNFVEKFQFFELVLISLQQSNIDSSYLKWGREGRLRRGRKCCGGKGRKGGTATCNAEQGYINMQNACIFYVFLPSPPPPVVSLLPLSRRISPTHSKNPSIVSKDQFQKHSENHTKWRTCTSWFTLSLELCQYKKRIHVISRVRMGRVEGRSLEGTAWGVGDEGICIGKWKGSAPSIPSMAHPAFTIQSSRK
jgi:hypothetical protein